MKRLLTLIVFTLGVTGCIGRKIVINPDDVSLYNDSDWSVISHSAVYLPSDVPGNNLDQWDQDGMELDQWERAE